MCTFMAGPNNMDTGQFLTYLYVLFLPIFIRLLFLSAIPQDPCLQQATYNVFVQGSSWQLRGSRAPAHRKQVKKCKKPRVSFRSEQGGSTNNAHSYLVPLAFRSFQVGCCLESWLQCRGLRDLPKQALSKLTAMNSELRAPGPYPIGFDSNSFPIGINTHASRCMAGYPHLFEDLQLSDKGKVEGINDGLKIMGKGTFKFKIEDNNGRTHKIKIPNSLYLPGLKRCLLLPQHWVQEAGAKHPLPDGTWCKNTATHNILYWDQKRFQKSVPHCSSTNTPVFYTALSSQAYRAFASTFEVLEAPYFRREHVLQYPGRRPIATEGPFNPMDLLSREEFIAEENLLLNKQQKSVDEGVTEDDETVQTANLPPPPANEEPHPGIACRGALTFDPSPPLEEDKEFQLAAANNQAELMRWHYRLGHLSFPKLKVLAKNGKIPCCLAKVPPPKCAGCLFGAMTKIPWRGKESKATHQVFVATKPGECVSVNHMVSTHVCFFA
jgi:hypothetical protein